MLREAELFVMAEEMLLEVLGRIRDGDWEIVLPALSDVPGRDRPTSMRDAVHRYAEDDARAPEALAGVSSSAPAPSATVKPGDAGWHVRLAGVVDAASAAARAVEDSDDATRDYLQLATIERCFLANEVAMHLGSTACPLPEELARGIWELTEPHAESWRVRKVFREPLPLPDHVSWRDRFLLSAGREPHLADH